MINLFCPAILRRPSIFIPLAFLIWTCSLWGFLSGRVGLSSDAVSYYEHTKFFLDQIGRGQFPLWDPYWSAGAPNDFFLRRIGPYNPFLLLPLALNKCGLSFLSAYLIFQAVYFFCGMTGFYLLARNLLRDRSAAFLAFLLLTFSALSTRMFDSYMLLVTIPAIWFFYFLTAFFICPRRAHAAGLTLAFMLLVTTYIPLFFLVIFLFFVLVYALFFWRDIPARLFSAAAFMFRNRFFSAVCLAAALFAVIPGVSFFGDAGKGGIAIPGRHFNTEARHVLIVEPQLLSPWSIMEEFFFSFYYTDLTRIAFAIVYVPLFALLVLGAGIFSPLTRLFMFLSLWGLCLLLFSMPIGFPLYGFLYQHLGFVKYFRNLHFLLWFAGLPIFALFVGESWKNLARQASEPDAWGLWIVVVTVHYLAFLFLVWQGDTLFSTYLALALSFGVWIIFLSPRAWLRQWLLPALLLAVVVQPVEVFYHLARNYPVGPAGTLYNGLDYKFSYRTASAGEGRIATSEDRDYSSMPGKPAVPYYSTDIYRSLVEKVSLAELEQYERFKFYLYDQKPPVGDLSGAFGGVPVKTGSDLFSVISFNVNSISLKAHLPAPKFVVYNDVNYPGWILQVNGRKQLLETANGAFKGFWLPAGDSVAVLRFGPFSKHFMNWALMASVYGMLIYVILLYRRGKHAAD